MRRKDRQIKDINEIESIISCSDVCRVAFADNNTPYIVTMNFGYSGGDHMCLYFHCATEGKKMDMIKKNNYVCFEMDTDHRLYKGTKGCDWGMKYSSIVGYGNISVIAEMEEKRTGLNYIMKHYAGSGDFSYDTIILEKMVVLRLDIREMTGKKC